MNRFNLSLPRGRVGLIWGLSLGLLMAWAALAVAQWDDFPKPLRPGETPPTFRVGEKAEAYWRGKFYPGVVTKVDSSSGWVNVEITADGKLQSAYVSPQAGFVRKVAGGATAPLERQALPGGVEQTDRRCPAAAEGLSRSHLVGRHWEIQN